MTCDNCKTSGHHRLRSLGAGIFVCGRCTYSVHSPTIAEPIVMTHLRDYGPVSVKRLKALDSRVMLPDNHPGTGYYVGTRLPNGKIIDKEPNVHK